MQESTFKRTTRDERQEECRVKWIKNKCKGTIVASTGFGKTRVGLNCIKTVLKKYPSIKVIVIVPTTALKEQWLGLLDLNGLSLNCEVLVINTAIKGLYKCDIMVIDEIHRVAADTLKHVFETVNYKYILGLTATFERLDGKHELLKKYCPVIDEITLAESKFQGWISDYKEYQVILDVDDIATYKEMNRKFTESFEFFNFDWDKVMSCLGPKGFMHRSQLRDEMCPNGTEEQRKQVFKQITYHATQFMRIIQSRKAFINNHPKKIEVARRIIQARPDSKIITFSNNVKMAESIGMGGKVFSGKDSKKKGRMTIEEFSAEKTGILHTIKKADEGLDVPGLSVAIILGLDSSKIRKTQRIGRVARKEGDKKAEIFTLVLDQTVETEWLFYKDFIEYTAVPIEKSLELSLGNIGETPEMDNTEINIETKESISSYSVDNEPLN